MVKALWLCIMHEAVMWQGKYQRQHTHSITKHGRNNKAVKLTVALHTIKGHSRAFLRINCPWHIKIYWHERPVQEFNRRRLIIQFLCVKRILSIRALLAAYLYVSTAAVRFFYLGKYNWLYRMLISAYGTGSSL